MRALEFITGHVIYNPAYTYKFQLKTNDRSHQLNKLALCEDPAWTGVTLITRVDLTFMSREQEIHFTIAMTSKYVLGVSNVPLLQDISHEAYR